MCIQEHEGPLGGHAGLWMSSAIQLIVLPTGQINRLVRREFKRHGGPSDNYVHWSTRLRREFIPIIPSVQVRQIVLRGLISALKADVDSYELIRLAEDAAV